MKTNLKSLLILLFTLPAVLAFPQSKKDSLGLPGDNFDLYGALELFKQSKSPEAFEKAINSSDNEVNNLDLDADGKVDYIKVTDKANGSDHAIVMQVAVSKTELQDVAVIEVEKSGSENAHLQIVGDEELYGKNYIVEPRANANNENKNVAGYQTTSADDVYKSADTREENVSFGDRYTNTYNNDPAPVVVNVWAWPSVQYIYGPAYVGWVSPYYWGHYPGWWDPWYPVYYPIYYRRVYRYHHPYYYRTAYYRCNNIHNYYYGRRSASETVRRNNSSGHYRSQQESYRNNPVHGRRYNSMPADPGKNMNRSRQEPRVGQQGVNRDIQRQRAGEINTPGGNRARQEQQSAGQPRKTTRRDPVYANPNGGNQGRQEGRRQEAAPRQGETARPQEQPRRQNPSGGRSSSSPRGSQGGGSRR